MYEENKYFKKVLVRHYFILQDITGYAVFQIILFIIPVFNIHL